MVRRGELGSSFRGGSWNWVLLFQAMSIDRDRPASRRVGFVFSGRVRKAPNGIATERSQFRGTGRDGTNPIPRNRPQRNEPNFAGWAATERSQFAEWPEPGSSPKSFLINRLGQSSPRWKIASKMT